jgi:hypothetical protein
MTTAEIKTAIENGAKFNGVVYGKDNGKHWTTLFVYLDGKHTKIKEVPKSESAAKKAEYLAEIMDNTNASSKEFNTNCGFYGTAADAARGYDGIE